MPRSHVLGPFHALLCEPQLAGTSAAGESNVSAAAAAATATNTRPLVGPLPNQSAIAYIAPYQQRRSVQWAIRDPFGQVASQLAAKLCTATRVLSPSSQSRSSCRGLDRSGSVGS